MSKWREETIGDCRLILGDCRDVLPTLGSVDVLMTDPPYGVGKAAWDEAFPTDWWVLAREHCETAFIMCGNSAIPICIEMVGTDYRDVFVLWLCNGMTLGPVSFGNWIPVVVAQRERKHLGGQNHIRTVVNAEEKIDHPSPKPLDAMVKLVASQTTACGTVLDPFMGSGTTGVACVKLGRKFIGIEIEPKYFDISCRRLEDAYSRPDLFIEAAKTPEPPLSLFDERAA